MGTEFGYSDSTKGAIAAFFSLGYMLGLVPSGIGSATGSPKTVLFIGLLIWSVAQYVTPFSAVAGVSVLLFTRAAMGAGEAACIPSLQVIAANFVTSSNRSRFWGFVTASLSVGTVGAYFIAPPLIDTYGWPSIFKIFGGVGGALALLWWQYGASTPVGGVVECDPILETCALPEEGPTLTFPLEEEPLSPLSLSDLPWKQILTYKPVWALASAHAASNVFLYFSLSWLPTYFSYQFNMDTNAAAGASTLPFVAGAIGSLLAGTIADALVSNGVSLTNVRKAMQSVALGGPIIGLLALNFYAQSIDFTTAETIFILMAGCQSVSSAGFGCAAQDISRRLASLIYGGTSAVAVIAGAGGQYITGAVLEATNRDFTPLFTATAGVEAAGLLVWLLFWDSKRVFE